MDFAITAHCISPVIFAGRDFEERHKVEISQTHFLEIRNFGFHPIQIAREKVHITNTAQHLVRLKPIWIRFADLVEHVQIVRSNEPGTCQADEQVFKMKEEIISVTIYFNIQLEQCRKVFIKACDEFVPALCIGRDVVCQRLFHTRKQALLCAICFAFDVEYG
jgi:hypothetical protein